MKTQFLTKATLSLALVGSLSILNAQSLSNGVKIQTLSGDTKLSCEALLCLASPIKPSECSPSLARYFGISAKKWKDTITKRKNFLKLCPVDNSDSQMVYYRDQVVANLDSECTIPALNKRVEKQIIRVEKVCAVVGDNGCATFKEINIYGFRVNPNLPRSCALLASSAYTDYRLKYTCNKQFYDEVSWNRGYTLKEVSKNIYFTLKESEREQGSKLIPVSQSEFYKLPQEERKITQNYNALGGYITQYNKIVVSFYQKIPIKKDCWIND
ncbi:TrbM/KikA/MpfK family conjugal transfer protein [Helicobacter sp. UBA3407]|uniref:TrbM/KikA/MpfK family conjugal transfer protein n=1 Tax=Helicobacter TaxID=209 RepID=UPI0026092C59|nr:TrbM/KikA/MpfK family conjugal transfer protein [Helicobacter sp. UBA3407]